MQLVRMTSCYEKIWRLYFDDDRIRIGINPFPSQIEVGLITTIRLVTTAMQVFAPFMDLRIDDTSVSLNDFVKTLQLTEIDNKTRFQGDLNAQLVGCTAVRADGVYFSHKPGHAHLKNSVVHIQFKTMAKFATFHIIGCRETNIYLEHINIH